MTMYYGGCHIRVSFEQMQMCGSRYLEYWLHGLLQKDKTTHTESSATLTNVKDQVPEYFSSLKFPYLCHLPGYVMATLHHSILHISRFPFLWASANTDFLLEFMGSQKLTLRSPPQFNFCLLWLYYTFMCLCDSHTILSDNLSMAVCHLAYKTLNNIYLI